MENKILEKFYKALAGNDENSLKKIHIPRSDVFYVQQAIYQDTGVFYDLDRIERAMYLEGLLEERDVYKPDVKRDWEE